MMSISEICFLHKGRYYKNLLLEDYYYPNSNNIITITVDDDFNDKNIFYIKYISSKLKKDLDIWTKWVITFDQKNSFKLKFSITEDVKKSVKIDISKENFLDFLKKRYPEDFLAISFYLEILSGKIEIKN